jgi:hypothetical protein
LFSVPPPWGRAPSLPFGSASLRTSGPSPRLPFPLDPRGSTGASTPTLRWCGFASLLTPSASLLALRLRFAPDKWSAPKAPVSFEPPRADRGVDPYIALVRVRLTPHSFRLTSLRTSGQSPKLPWPLTPDPLPLAPFPLSTFRFLLSPFYFPLSTFPFPLSALTAPVCGR